MYSLNVDCVVILNFSCLQQTPEFQKDLKHRILLGVHSSICSMFDNKIRRKICGVAIELAKQCMDALGNNLWPEFLDLLYVYAMHSPTYQQTALEIFSSFPGIFGNKQTHYSNVIKEILEVLLDNSEYQAIRYAAMKSFTAYVTK